uniref:Bradykinin-potentiating peptide 11a n=2 Tax=Crotalus adamanteus TaxID=8729 RepID=BP11A_CROAD|nr:RecName: Full=Bradykinin-potentiating peptide 11a; Short=BPP-11a [Crotalus adamanteus]
QQWPPGHHIPP